MRRPRRPAGQAEGGGHDATGMMRWLLTYADLITLLMAFFIVMYAMSSVDVGKYRALAHSLRGALAGNSFVELPLQGTAAEPDSLEAVGREVAGALAEMGLEGQGAVFRTERGVVISLYGAVLFDLGRADIRPDALPVLDRVAEALARVPNYVSVEGSTDDLPINSLLFPTNWELSVRRATTVVRYFVERHGLEPRRFLAVGYGEYQPMFPNDSEANRARNRRVDIVLL
ncbi:MAG: flagellar motor protein MotB, partial [Bacillota bacterium]